MRTLAAPKFGSVYVAVLNSEVGNCDHLIDRRKSAFVYAHAHHTQDSVDTERSAEREPRGSGRGGAFNTEWLYRRPSPMTPNGKRDTLNITSASPRDTYS